MEEKDQGENEHVFDLACSDFHTLFMLWVIKVHLQSCDKFSEKKQPGGIP